MSYNKTLWINRETPINASNLNKIENAIFQLTEDSENTNADLAALKKSIKELSYEQQSNLLTFKMDDITYSVSIPVDAMIDKAFTETKLPQILSDYTTNFYTKEEIDEIIKELAKSDNDITVFENHTPLDKDTQIIQLSVPDLFTGHFTNEDRSIINPMGMLVGDQTYPHKTLTSFGCFMFKDIQTIDIGHGSIIKRIAVQIYRFELDDEGYAYFKKLSTAEINECISSNLIVCHENNKSYRLSNYSINFNEYMFGETTDISLLNKFFFVETPYILTLGESDVTAFAGNRGKALEDRMTSIESSVANIPNEIEEQFNDRIGATKIVNLTQSEYEALETKDSDTFYFVVED